MAEHAVLERPSRQGKKSEEMNEIREIAEGKEGAPGCIVCGSEARLCGMEGRGILTEQQKNNWYIIRALLNRDEVSELLVEESYAGGVGRGRGKESKE